MVTFITIFNFVAGACSILGLLYLYYVKNNSLFNGISVVIFTFTLLVCLYILFVPTSFLTENVRHKVNYFRKPVSVEMSSGLLIQKGELRFSGLGPVAVEFDPPYFESPVVEVINIDGYKDEATPKVIKRTPHQVQFSRDEDFFGSGFARYIWVARGVPLVNR